MVLLWSRLLWIVKDWKDLKLKAEMFCFCGMHYCEFLVAYGIFFFKVIMGCQIRIE